MESPMLTKRIMLSLLIVVMLTSSIDLPALHAQDATPTAADTTPDTPPPTSVSVTELDPHFAVDWMELIYDRVRIEGQNPPLAARTYAYAGITLYEAILNGTPNNYTLAGQIEHMPDMPLPAEDGVYDWITVANHALYRVMSQLLPTNPQTKAETRVALTQHYDALNAEREAEVGAEVVENSIGYADELADTLLDWIADDNLEYIRSLPEYVIPDFGEGGWVTTSEGQVPIEPYWGQMRPFMMNYASQCSVPLNMPFSTDPDSTFYQQALEVQRVGSNVPPDVQELVFFWIDALSQTGTPGGHWMLIAGQMVDQLNLGLIATAEMYAQVGIAVADSFISAWEAKYRYMLIRPVTYINRYIRRSWGPIVQTPGFPEYPSGHSVTSQAAATVLTNMFGTVAFTDSSGLRYDYQPRSFTSFQAAASEAAISRMYGGIHYRAAIENGLIQGACVGNNVFNNLTLHPFQQGE